MKLDTIETRDPPSLLNRVISPPLFLAGGISAILWFVYSVSLFFQNLSAPIILFNKGSYYMLGVGIGLLSLAFVLVKEFWIGEPITNRQSVIFSRIAISGVILLFVVPHIAHFSAETFLEKQGYSVCEEASHQWLFVRDIVYVADSIDCSEKLEK